VKLHNYIGLACSLHDPAVAIVNSRGELVFAEATERSLQSKRGWNAVPDQLNSIGKLMDEYCEPDADMVVALTWSDNHVPPPEVHLTREALVAFKKDGLPPAIDRHPVWGWEAKLGYLVTDSEYLSRRLAGNQTWLRAMERNRRVRFTAFDHHLTHAAFGCFTSPFEAAVCAVIDGMGEAGSISCYTYDGGQLTPLRDAPATDLYGSLGTLYSLVTDVCGWDWLLGEEWKVMGLAPYGKFDEAFYESLKKLITIDGNKLRGPTSLAHRNAVFHEITSRMRDVKQPTLAAANLAFTGQQFFEELTTSILMDLKSRDISPNLVLVGGTALNSTFAGKICDRIGFSRLYIPSAPADDGNAVGAALLAHRALAGESKPRSIAHQTPYLGSKISSDALERLIAFNRGGSLNIGRHDDYVDRAAKMLADGKIIGWVQGRAEFGPRALGNRSILADPRPIDMKDRINAKVKFREEFRPFAPSILHEFGDEYFESYQESPYMERTLRFKPTVREKLPAVVHKNQSGRLQTVKEAWNPNFYRLIKAFHRLTGIPLLLNTSFNIMGKPIMHSVEDAIALFMTTGLDALFIEDVVVVK